MGADAEGGGGGYARIKGYISVLIIMTFTSIYLFSFYNFKILIFSLGR